MTRALRVAEGRAGMNRPARIGVLMVGTALMALTAAPAAAQSGTVQTAQQTAERRFDIPAQSLSDGLALFGRQSGLQVSVDAALIRGVATPGVSGTLTPQRALDRLLTGTGFSHRISGSGTVVLVPPPVAGGDGAVVLSPVQVEAAQPVPAGELYIPQPSSVATKTTLPPRQTPFTVNQASEELIRERGDQTLFDTLEGFAGVTTLSSNADIGQGMSRSINVRGFDMASSGQMLLNGQRSYSAGSLMRTPDNLEAVELLRGPAALYYGAAQPGGILNYSYKRPKDKAAYSVEGKTDSQGSYGGSIDLTGPLDAERTLRYRLVANHSRYEDDQDRIWSKAKSILAAGSWVPSPEFDTTVTYEYYDYESVPEQENNKLDPTTGAYFPVPRDFFWGQTNDRAVRTMHTVLWDVRWRPSTYVNVSANANYQTADQWYQNTRIVGGGRGGVPAGSDAAGNVPRYVSLRPAEEYESYSGGMDLTGSVLTGGFKHDWLVGGGGGRTRNRTASLPPDVTCLFGQAAPSRTCPNARSWAPPPLNMHDPQYGAWPYQWLRDQAEFKVPWTERRDLNVYFQDMLHLPDGRTRVLAAAGWSQYKSTARGSYNYTTGQRSADTRSTASKWSPRFAVMHDILPDATVYASYGESFIPQSSLTLTDQSGTALVTPEQGVQYEVGYKQDLFGGSAMVAVSLFRIDKKNIARAANADTCDTNVSDASQPDYCYYALDGLQRSQGLEFELSGLLTPWWSASLGYSYLDTETVKTDDPANQGKPVPYVSRHNVSLWNKFRLHQDDRVGTVSLGVGLRAYSKANNGYDANGDTDWNPGYGIVNMGLFWDKELSDGTDLRVALNVNNLFDKTYYDRRRYTDSGTIVWGNERRVLLNAKVTF